MRTCLSHTERLNFILNSASNFILNLPGSNAQTLMIDFVIYYDNPLSSSSSGSLSFTTSKQRQQHEAYKQTQKKGQDCSSVRKVF